MLVVHETGSTIALERSMSAVSANSERSDRIELSAEPYWVDLKIVDGDDGNLIGRHGAHGLST